MTDAEVTNGPWDATPLGIVRRAIGVCRALEESVCLVSATTWHALTLAQRAAFLRQSAALGLDIVPQSPTTTDAP